MKGVHTPPPSGQAGSTDIWWRSVIEQFDSHIKSDTPIDMTYVPKLVERMDEMVQSKEMTGGMAKHYLTDLMRLLVDGKIVVTSTHIKPKSMVTEEAETDTEIPHYNFNHYNWFVHYNWFFLFVIEVFLFVVMAYVVYCHSPQNQPGLSIGYGGGAK